MRLLASSSLFLVLLLSAGTAVAQSRAEPPSGYRIQQGDKLSVKFFNNKDLDECCVVVRPDGYITLQLIGDIRAEGRTMAELKKELEKVYDEILLEPIITVALIEFIPPHVFIMGQINKPGRYELREAKTLMQAVFLAGGFTRDANRKMVLHARPDGKGGWVFRSADVVAMLNPKGTEHDIDLKSGDYLYIPESRMAKFSRIVDSVRGMLPGIY